ncbi:MAG: hypothetical protein KatS3mg102_1434 [Planctomycetota bacterium]|nr:MAG: hypothetical protein KatS3mg102_1434 [Planctomycetota bacterium]
MASDAAAATADLLALLEAPIDPEAVRRSVQAPAAGAEVLFVGTVRARTAGREVRYLEYEAYRPMAQRRFAEIAAELRARHGICGVAIVHRLGRLAPGEIAVAIAVSAPHREAAYRASREAIEAVKHTAPIWKREVFADGAVWVAASGG